MWLPGARAILSVLRFIYWYASMVRKVAIFRSPAAQLLDIIALARRHDLDAQAYYMFEFYRPEEAARAGSYLTRYETKNGLFKLLLRQHPEYKQKTQLDDKAGFRDFCAEQHLPHPTLLGIARDGRLDLEPGVPAPLDQDIFVKPADSKGSKDCELFRAVAPGQYIDGVGRSFDWPALSTHLAGRSRERPLIVQRLLKNHPDMAPLAGESVLAIRMITCWDRRGEAILAYAMLRIIPKLELEWALESELGAAVDRDTGRLGQMTGDKVNQLLNWWDNHPVTGAQVNGRIVPHWTEAKRIVLAAQRATRGRYLVGWDVAITPDGPVLLEGNAFPDVDYPQRTHRCGIGDSPLGPPLHDRLLELRDKLGAAKTRKPSGASSTSPVIDADR